MILVTMGGVHDDDVRANSKLHLQHTIRPNVMRPTNEFGGIRLSDNCSDSWK